jgi:hypothetical protein
MFSGPNTETMLVDLNEGRTDVGALPLALLLFRYEGI